MSEQTIRADRRRLLKGGVIAFNQRHSTLPCTVRNLSETGCLLASENAIAIPDTFELLIDLDGIAVDCEVIRRAATTVGVRFTSPIVRSAPRRVQVVTASASHLKPTLRRVRV